MSVSKQQFHSSKLPALLGAAVCAQLLPFFAHSEPQRRDVPCVFLAGVWSQSSDGIDRQGFELGVEIFTDQQNVSGLFSGVMLWPTEIDGTGDAPFGGLCLAMRWRIGQRFSAFAGYGGSVAWAARKYPSGLIEVLDVEASAFVEGGVSMRLHENFPFTASVRYYFTSRGRDHDLWTTGVGFGWAL